MGEESIHFQSLIVELSTAERDHPKKRGMNRIARTKEKKKKMKTKEKEEEMMKEEEEEEEEEESESERQ